MYIRDVFGRNTRSVAHIHLRHNPLMTKYATITGSESAKIPRNEVLGTFLPYTLPFQLKMSHKISMKHKVCCSKKCRLYTTFLVSPRILRAKKSRKEVKKCVFSIKLVSLKDGDDAE